MYILNEDRRFTFANAFALSAWKRQAHEMLGERFEDALPIHPSAEVVELLQQAIVRQERTEFETFGLNHRGWVGVVAYPNAGGVTVCVRRLRGNAPTATDAERDALTDCLTRAAYTALLPRLALPHVLALIDLNRLKSVNSLRGHGGGDLHIRQVAEHLLGILPAGSVMGRWGGDEFVVLVPGTDSAALQSLLDHAQQWIPSPFPGVPAFSVGLAVWPQDTPYERAFSLADESLQHQKNLLNDAVPGDWDALAFIEFSQRLEDLHEPDDIIQHALESLITLLDFDHAVYMELDGNEMYVSHQSIRGGLPLPDPPMNVRIPVGGLILSVRRTQQTAWSTDYPSNSEVIPLIVEQGAKSIIVTPVFSQGKIISTIILRSVHRWHTITPHIRKVTELTALRLEHALDLRRVVRDVRSTLEAGLLTLGTLLEARDLETHGHTQRAACMAAQLGAALGLRRNELDMLRQGAYLHDLGTLFIPDTILLKPGRLTPDEWRVVQTHVLHGWQLASRIPGLSPDVLNVIRHHHERWDGTGYPDGLTGDQIPLEARIFAVCDVYDALISERPYKAAWTPGDARRELQAQAGRHFDPVVVETFLALSRATGEPA